MDQFINAALIAAFAVGVAVGLLVKWTLLRDARDETQRQRILRARDRSTFNKAYRDMVRQRDLADAKCSAVLGAVHPSNRKSAELAVPLVEWEMQLAGGDGLQAVVDRRQP